MEVIIPGALFHDQDKVTFGSSKPFSCAASLEQLGYLAEPKFLRITDKILSNLSLVLLGLFVQRSIMAIGNQSVVIRVSLNLCMFSLSETDMTVS